MTIKKSREIIDELHRKIDLCIQRQSERDFPRGSISNGIIDDTKIQSSERKGNLFCLLCIAHKTDGINALVDGVWNRHIVDENGNHKAQLQLKKTMDRFYRTISCAWRVATRWESAGVSSSIISNNCQGTEWIEDIVS